MEKKKPGTVTVPKENVKELLGKAKDGIVKAMDQNGDGTFDMRMDTAHEVRRQNPEIKIALLCDNVSDESSAYKVKCAKEDGSIDAFFYESVPSDYLADAIDAL